MTIKYTPVNDYINQESVIRWGTIAKDTPQERAQIMPDDRVANIRRLSLQAAREALSSNKEVLLPGKVVVKTQDNKTLLVTQECYKTRMTSSHLRAGSAQDALTGKSISSDDFRSKKALFIGKDAFLIDSLMMHILNSPPTKQLKHPVQDRFLTEEEQIQFLAELSLCYLIEDPFLLEQALCDTKQLSLLQNISHASDLIFLMNTERLFACMKQSHIKKIAPHLWSKFENLMNSPHILNLLQRPSLKSLETKLSLRLANQQGFKGYNLNAPDPLQDYKDKKSFIYWGSIPIKNKNALDSEKSFESFMEEHEDDLDRYQDDPNKEKMTKDLYMTALKAKQGDILYVASDHFHVVQDDADQRHIFLERVIPIERKSHPKDIATIANEKDDKGCFLDPISFDSISLEQLRAANTISIGNYVFTLDSCLFRMLSQLQAENGGIPHPFENRSLTIEEEVNFLVDLSQKLGIQYPTNIRHYCWNDAEKDLLEDLKKQHFGIAPFVRFFSYPPFSQPDPSLTPDVLFAANASLLLREAPSNIPILENLRLKRNTLFQSEDVKNNADTIIKMVIDVIENDDQ